jgi:hypothetical protein
MNALHLRSVPGYARARAGVLILALLGAACASEAPEPSDAPADTASGATVDSGPAAPADTSPAAPADTAPRDTAPAPPPDTGWSVGVREARPDLEATFPIPVVQAARTGVNEGFDRFTIELGDGAGMPGYHVEYVDKPLHQCGSGQEIFPVGDAWLEVRLEPAQAHPDEGRPTLSGREMPANFEGVVSLVVAVSTPNRYRVSTLQSPRRIVVDVRH